MTALPPPVALLEARLGVAVGSLAAEDLARAEAALEDASVLITAEVSAADATVWSDPTVGAPAVVVTVALQAAKRAFVNPDGLKYEAVEGYTASVDAVGVYLTDAEKALVRGVSTPTGQSKRGGWIGSVRTPSPWPAERGRGAWWA